MSKPIFEVLGLGKRYLLPTGRSRYLSLREQLGKTLGRSAATEAKPGSFWALRDVSFQVEQGEALGIVGRNGAGKSTLLKLLSQITTPTEGRVTMRGRAASLLEVGTGFHPELTGRENVYLNGAILGMTRSEIARKFDEIVAFAGVEQFLDLPVKRYSSGMYVRLAFAVAAHLEPEILFVDEVLAVGDAEFQAKCLGKMTEVCSSGRTILFVSHNANAIKTLCPRSILLDAGGLIAEGPSGEIIRQYQRPRIAAEAVSVGVDSRGGNGRARVRSSSLLDDQGRLIDFVRSGQECSVRFSCEAYDKISELIIAFTVYDSQQRPLFRPSSHDRGRPFSTGPGRFTIDCQIPRLPLVPDVYRIIAELRADADVADHYPFAYDLIVEPGSFFETTSSAVYSPLIVDHDWKIEQEGGASQ